MERGQADDDDRWLTDLPPTLRQSWSVIAVTAVALVAFAAVIPFADRPLVALNALFPSLDAIVFVTSLVTSVLLFAQFAISGSHPLLVLANGYLFTALIVIPHALTFSGAFSATGLLGANAQTGSWLFIFWHFGFAASLLAYAWVTKEARAAPVSEVSTLPAIGRSLAGALVLVCGLSWLATDGATLLPRLILDGARISPLVVYPISFTMLIFMIAIAVLLACRRSMLNQWLMVVALVSVLELAFSGLFPSVRFSAGFYAGRVFSLVTSSIVLIVALAETTWLYARVARSNAMLRRERNNKLMSLEAMTASIAHEVRQPLATIALEGETTLLLLGQSSPDLKEAESAVQGIVRASQRANEIFNNIRSLFGNAELKKERLDINSLTLEMLLASKFDLEKHGIETRIELASKLPPVMGHKGQLQEVITNLVQNAIEAMDEVDRHRRVLKVRTEIIADDAVAVEIADTGPGLGPEPNAIFDAFMTTKPHGMGLGLAICRMIVERHNGRLSASPGDPGGAVVRMVLPQMDRHHTDPKMHSPSRPPGL
jgi:signal transduction histidine kinase